MRLEERGGLDAAVDCVSGSSPRPGAICQMFLSEACRALGKTDERRRGARPGLPEVVGPGELGPPVHARRARPRCAGVRRACPGPRRRRSSPGRRARPRPTGGDRAAHAAGRGPSWCRRAGWRRRSSPAGRWKWARAVFLRACKKSTGKWAAWFRGRQPRKTASTLRRRSSGVPSLTITSVARARAASRRDLGGDPPPRVLRVAALLLPAAQALGLGRDDEQDAVVVRFGARLEELRGLGRRRPARRTSPPRRRGGRARLPTRGWMRASRACRAAGSAKDALGDARPVDCPSGVENVVAEEVPRRRRARAARRVEPAHDRVGVEDDGAELAQDPGDRGFAGGETARSDRREHDDLDPGPATVALLRRPRRPS